MVRVRVRVRVRVELGLGLGLELGLGLCGPSKSICVFEEVGLVCSVPYI